MMLTLFASAHSNKPKEICELEDVVEMIKNAERGLKENIELIRAEPDSEQQNKMKKLLPAIAFSGEFTAHKNTALVKHSGLYVYDIDDMKPAKAKRMVANIESLVLAFASPRGNGLKVVLKGPKANGTEEHRDNWRLGATILENAILGEIDHAGNEVSRLCFLSPDNKLIYRKSAETFTSKEKSDDIMGDVPSPKADFKDYHIEQVQEMLWTLGSDIPYDQWRNIIYSVTSHCGRDDQIHDLLVRWCKECGGDRAFSGTEGDKLFESIFIGVGKGVTLATLIKAAKEAGWKDWRKMMRRDEEGDLIYDDANLRIALENHPDFKGRFWCDAISKRMLMTEQKKPIQAKITKGGGLIEEPLCFDILCDIQKNLRLGFRGTKTVMLAVTALAKHNTRNLRKEWLDSLPEWDGTKRCEHMFVEGFGAQNMERNRALSKSFICSAVARILRPGVPVNVVPILVGDQGVGKSSGIAALLPSREWFCDSFVELDSKEGYELVMRATIVELCELSALKKAEIERVKQFVTQCHVTFRAPYDKQPDDHKATWVFIGTTNEETFLRDSTGNRRFAPIKIVKAKVEQVVQWVTDNREQLWAEALYIVKEGMKANKDVWNVPKKYWNELAIAAEAARERDPWEDAVHDLSTRLQSEGYVFRKLNEFAMESNISLHGRTDELHLARLMKKWGWETKTIRVGGALVRRWRLAPIR